MPVEFNGIDMFYIGTVYGYNVETRELEVYIPKLMPGIAESSKDIDLKTNLGSDISTNIIYENLVKTSSTITVSAMDTDEPLPKIGSKVKIWFIESNIHLGYWTKFNPDELYEVIDEEKYKEVFYLNINDSNLTVSTMDEINIKLPYDAELVYTENDKTKTIEIGPDTELLNRVSNIEDRLFNVENRTLSLENRVSNIESYLDNYGTLDEFFVRGILPANVISLTVDSIENETENQPNMDRYTVYRVGRPVKVSYTVECEPGYFFKERVNIIETYTSIPDGEDIPNDAIEIDGIYVQPNPTITYEHLSYETTENYSKISTSLSKEYSGLIVSNPLKEGVTPTSDRIKIVNTIKRIN